MIGELASFKKEKEKQKLFNLIFTETPISFPEHTFYIKRAGNYTVN